MSSNEKHRKEFLDFYVRNEKRLRYNLKKNITYDPDIFDDAVQDAILKVCEAIDRGTVIEDFEKYFFIASKYAYIKLDNMKKRKMQQHDRDFIWNVSHGMEKKHDSCEVNGYLNLVSDDGDWKLLEDKDAAIGELFQFLSSRLNELFSPDEADIFLIYYRLKSEKTPISYKKMASITDRGVNEISNIIKKIKKFIAQDEVIQQEKRRLMKKYVDK